MVWTAVLGLALVTQTPRTTSQQPSAQVSLQKGMVLSKNCKVKPGTYSLVTNTDNTDKPAITIQGDGITVDFQGAKLQGTPPTLEPDKRIGLAVLVKGKNVTIKNLNVRGYRFGIIARNCPGIKLINCDLSYNWKQHLLSNLEREDGSDWLSYHRNEKDEWMRYGTSIYLRKCDGFEVKGCTAVGGQNGLMLTECNNGKVWNCNFSFLSGAGIAMYLSSRNQIMHNKIDWCVRGYSHGVYNRGQDSSGIIIYEQSNNNVFAYNSVTHGGDGFFLWAGQTSMDTGKGGCNDNLLYGNDFSHSPANGIEATFSRNQFVNNLLLECWHGIWGGYSWETKVIGNVFGLNGEAIAWEHGQNNEIKYNRFDRDSAGINLWADPADPKFAYAKAKDVRSINWVINRNTFTYETGTVLRIHDTIGAKLDGNSFERNGKIFDVAKNQNVLFSRNDVRHRTGEEPGNGVTIEGGSWRTSGEGAQTPLRWVDGNGTEVHRFTMDRSDYLALFKTEWHPTDLGWLGFLGAAEVAKYKPRPLAGGMNAMIPDGVLRGRRYILVDEWGPYDFKSPILWPRGATPAQPSDVDRPEAGERLSQMRFDILGPSGYWKISQLKGVKAMSKLAGTVPDAVDVTLEPGKASDILIELEYSGGQTTDARGIVTPKGRPAKFSFRKFFAPIAWDIKWFSYNKDTQEPRSQYASFQKLLESGTPILTEKSDRLEFNDGYRGVLKDLYATLAIGTLELPEGKYVLNCTSDDGVRIWVDGKMVIENWKWHGPELNTAEISGGKHEIRLEHFEIDGYSTLKVDIQPKK